MSLLFLVLFAAGAVTIANPSFEETRNDGRVIGWTAVASVMDDSCSRFTVDARRSHDGERSMRIENLDPAHACLMQDLRVAPGLLYRISAWARTQDIGRNAAGAGLTVRGLTRIAGDLRGDNEWQAVELYLKTGRGVDSVTLMLTLGLPTRPNQGIAWFDDVTLERIESLPDGVVPFIVKAHHLERASSWRSHSLMLILAGIVVLAAPLGWRFLGRTIQPKEAASASRVIRPDVLIFGGTMLLLWLALLPAIDRSLLHHSGADQHALQATLWREGRVSQLEDGGWLELSPYKGRYYVSFPPVPTLVELPLTLIFGRETPNTLALLLATWLSMMMAFALLVRLGADRRSAFLLAFAFFWGTNVLYLSLEGSVWHQGHLFGVCFALAAFLCVSGAVSPSRAAVGALLLGFSVGCRPFHVFTVPLYCYLACRRAPAWRNVAAAIIGFAPPIVFYAVYNIARFGSPFEFGHTFLPWSRAVEHGVFNLAYLPRNLFHAFAQLPAWDAGREILGFSGRGTAIWIHSPILLLGFGAFLSGRLPRSEKALIALALFLHWGGLLLHESNGWFQFGYRYGVDLIPVLVYAAGRLCRAYPWPLVPLVQYSVLLNLYGALWFYVLR
ncbi:MAG: hypothetical protein JXO72_12920 [Vicinamibacteria bacterium]|nr:hypothetical protein [Vicinamibacteria bacterium]